MRERDLPAFAPAAGWEHEAPATLADWVQSAKAVWREAKARYPRASLGAMAGLGIDRAERIVNGSAVPTPSEARALDAALGTDGSKFFPARRPLVQRPSDGARTERAPVRKTHALTGPRQARVDAWAARVAASGLTFVAIAEAAGLGLGRCMRILRQGAIEDAQEREALVDVLGDEPLTAENGEEVAASRRSPD